MSYVGKGSNKIIMKHLMQIFIVSFFLVSDLESEELQYLEIIEIWLKNILMIFLKIVIFFFFNGEILPSFQPFFFVAKESKHFKNKISSDW